jgi:hypothetical protein
LIINRESCKVTIALSQTKGIASSNTQGRASFLEQSLLHRFLSVASQIDFIVYLRKRILTVAVQGFSSIEKSAELQTRSIRPKELLQAKA